MIAIINIFLKIRFFIITTFKDISLYEEPVLFLSNQDYRTPPWNKGYNPNLVTYMHWGPAELSCRKDEIGGIMSLANHGYGVSSAIIMFSDVVGAWQGFWSLDKVHDVKGVDSILPEYDFEYCGSWKRKITATLHWGNDYDHSNKKTSKLNNIYGGWLFRPSEFYYTYSFDRNAHRVIWRIGGIAVKYENRGVSTTVREHLFTNSGKEGYCPRELKGSTRLNPMTIISFIHINN